MMRCIAIYALLATGVLANEPPTVPEGGLSHLYTTLCIDAETQQKGTCHVMQDIQGVIYTTFWQHDKLMFIRRSLPDGGYETVWERDTYRGI